MPLARPAQVGSWDIRAVHCVMASTKTRSKNSSSGITRSPSRSATPIREARVGGAVAMLANPRRRGPLSWEASLPSAALISTNQFKNGTHIEVDGTIYRILEFQHVKPGKGGAFVRTKLKRSSDGAVIDKTFRAGEKFRPVRTETRKMQFLYADGSDAHFMDLESYDQINEP